MPNRLLPTFGVAAILAGCAPTMETELGPARAIVVLNCGATPQGIARDCRVVREEPAGFGYGLHAKHGAEGRHDLNVEGGNEIWTPEPGSSSPSASRPPDLHGLLAPPLTRRPRARRSRPPSRGRPRPLRS